jgi:hypothetical protein
MLHGYGGYTDFIAEGTLVGNWQLAEMIFDLSSDLFFSMTGLPVIFSSYRPLIQAPVLCTLGPSTATAEA